MRWLCVCQWMGGPLKDVYRLRNKEKNQERKRFYSFYSFYVSELIDLGLVLIEEVATEQWVLTDFENGSESSQIQHGFLCIKFGTKDKLKVPVPVI